jgi:hypothetical protein
MWRPTYGAAATSTAVADLGAVRGAGLDQLHRQEHGLLVENNGGLANPGFGIFGPNSCTAGKSHEHKNYRLPHIDLPLLDRRRLFKEVSVRAHLEARIVPGFDAAEQAVVKRVKSHR